jgi:hypothetical protein
MRCNLSLRNLCDCFAIFAVKYFFNSSRIGNSITAKAAKASQRAAEIQQALSLKLPGENQDADNYERDGGHALDPNEWKVIAEHASGHYTNC